MQTHNAKSKSKPSCLEHMMQNRNQNHVRNKEYIPTMKRIQIQFQPQMVLSVMIIATMALHDTSTRRLISFKFVSFLSVFITKSSLFLTPFTPLHFPPTLSLSLSLSTSVVWKKAVDSLEEGLQYLWDMIAGLIDPAQEVYCPPLKCFAVLGAGLDLSMDFMIITSGFIIEPIGP